MAKNFRLYIKESLAPEKIVILDEAQSHYLKNVVKMSSQDTVSCFDGQNGEFSTSILNIGKKNITIRIADKIKPFYACPDIWLLFAPLKKDCTDFIIEKATELGCRRILPVITEHTNTLNIKIDRYLAQSIEAAEPLAPEGTDAGDDEDGGIKEDSQEVEGEGQGEAAGRDVVFPQERPGPESHRVVGGEAGKAPEQPAEGIGPEGIAVSGMEEKERQHR